MGPPPAVSSSDGVGPRGGPPRSPIAPIPPSGPVGSPPEGPIGSPIGAPVGAPIGYEESVENGIMGAPLPAQPNNNTSTGTLSNIRVQSEALKTLMNSYAVRRAVSLKNKYNDEDLHYIVDKVQFDVLGKEETNKLAEREIVNRELYVHLTNTPHPFGVLDLHLGNYLYLYPKLTLK